MDLSPRLSALVNNALKYPIAEIVAPAGFGKSTIVGAVASALDFAVARVRSETDPTLALMRALCNAVSAQVPDLVRALPNAYANVKAKGQLRDLVPWFLDSLPTADAKIAVDDLHVLGDDAIAWRLLSDVVDGSSPRTRWILTSRVRTRLPDVEWIARGHQAKPITEKDLAFEADDIVCVSRELGVNLSPDKADKIRQLTKGWPLMSVYALRLIAQGDDFSVVDDVVTVSGVEALAERLLSQATKDDVRVLLATALFDGASYDDLDGIHPELNETLSRLVAFGIPLIQGGDGRWRLHDLFRDYLSRRESSLLTLEAARIATELDSKGRFAEALRVAIAGQARDAVQDLLERRIRYFADDIDRNLVEEALTSLKGRSHKSWQLSVIRGCDEFHRGKVELATHFFREAVSLSSGRDRTIALARLVHGLIFAGDPEGVKVLRQCESVELPDEAEQACEILSILTWAYVFTGAIDAAERVIGKAIALLPRVDDPLIEAIVYVRAGLAAFNGGRLDRADEFARLAIEIGERNRYFEIMARAFSIRKLIAAPERERDAILFTRQSAHCAARILDRIGVYWAEASLLTFACRAGDLTEARALVKRLIPIPDDLNVRIGAPVRILAAHVSMLEGDYEKAELLLSQVGAFGSDTMEDGGITTVRELGFHQLLAFLCHIRSDFEEANRNARRVLTLSLNLNLRGMEVSATPELEISKIMCAALLAINGQIGEGELVLRGMAKNARELYRRDLASWALSALDDPSAEPSEEAKTYANGIITLIRRALETKPSSAALTPAERRVLESLSEGRASKEIAAVTGRSVKTVDNQVASIMRKLSARSRGEAVARARRSGLLRDPEREASPV